MTILEEELSFLQSGGLIISRTSTAFEAFRDAGILTIDVGRAELNPGLRNTLSEIGYRDPASIVAFGVSATGATVDALESNILAHNADFLFYQVGE